MDALALVELDAVATGLRALDALVKKAPVTVLEANLIEPGRFLLLFAGEVAPVEASFAEAQEVGAGAVVDALFLPFAHPQMVPGLRGALALPPAPDTLGVVEASRVASALAACDACLKGADVSLVGLRVAGGLGGRGYFVLHGVQHDVDAAMEAAASVLGVRGALHRIERIARPHPEMVPFLLRPAPFAPGSL
jgi:microcompartment protein CcmL/EutN